MLSIHAVHTFTIKLIFRHFLQNVPKIIAKRHVRIIIRYSAKVIFLNRVIKMHSGLVVRVEAAR